MRCGKRVFALQKDSQFYATLCITEKKATTDAAISNLYPVEEEATFYSL